MSTGSDDSAGRVGAPAPYRGPENGLDTLASLATRPATPSFVDSVGLIAGREIRMRVRSKAFLWSTAVLMLAVLASVVLGSIFGAQESTTKVAVVAGASAVVDGNAALEPVAASDREEAEELLRSGEVDAIVAPAASEPLGITVIGLDSTPESVVEALAVGFAPDLIGTRGSGATSVRVSLYRRARKDSDYLAKKKVIVWCFAAREFTESDQGWDKEPVGQ